MSPTNKKKTLLLCFIHGFKGGDDTFGNFPHHLRAILSHALPNLSVVAITYPKFETRGDLKECVARFKEWLQNKVIDFEVANSTPSPTIDPSVHVILIGHSMGGIVAAETLLSITNEQPIPPLGAHNTAMTNTTSAVPSSPPPLSETTTLMFPHITGVLAFDTPYLGISPSVVAHGAESHWNTATTAYNAYTSISSVFGWGNGAKSPPKPATPQKALPPTLARSTSSTSTASVSAPTVDDAATTPLWSRWGKYAMFAGAAGAVAAGGAAAYLKRDTISQGWTWVGSHLEFVGCLARAEDLRQRHARVLELRKARGVGFGVYYTTLGAAVEGKAGKVAEVLGRERTFCNVPKVEGTGKGGGRECWWEARNDVAGSEIAAHCGMFEPRANPGYYRMAEGAKDVLVGWVTGGEGREWYETARKGDVESVGAQLEEEAEMVDLEGEAEAEAGVETRGVEEGFEEVR